MPAARHTSPVSHADTLQIHVTPQEAKLLVQLRTMQPSMSRPVLRAIRAMSKFDLAVRQNQSRTKYHDNPEGKGELS